MSFDIRRLKFFLKVRLCIFSFSVIGSKHAIMYWHFVQNRSIGIGKKKRMTSHPPANGKRGPKPKLKQMSSSQVKEILSCYVNYSFT